MPQISGAAGVIDGAIEISSQVVPVSGTSVQDGLHLGLCPAQLGLEHLSEQRMQAIPLMARLRGSQRHIGARQLSQYGG